MKRKFLLYALAAAANALLYLNCSGFKAGGVSLENFASSCKGKLQLASKITFQNSQCEDTANYSCEKRVFSPNVENQNFSSEYCGESGGRSFCVNTLTMKFNTETARSPETESEFAVGGEFNRDDYQCSYNLKVGETPIIQIQGTSVLDALTNAIAACEKRVVQ